MPMKTSFSHELALKPFPFIVRTSPEVPLKDDIESMVGTLHSVNTNLYFEDVCVVWHELISKSLPEHEDAVG